MLKKVIYYLYSFKSIKVKAGALQYTIFISVVIALLVFAFIGLTFLQQRIQQKTIVFNDISLQNDLAFLLYINNDGDNRLLDSAENNIETQILKKKWGMFDIVSITSKKGKEKITKTALIGGNSESNLALYIQDENQPLVVVGNTKIEGKAFLPEQGIKRGSIAGHSYINNRLVYGNTYKSNSNLPLPKNIGRLKYFKDSIVAIKDFNFLDINSKQQLIKSFNSKAYLFYTSEAISLKNIKLAGNIIVQSDNKVIIHESANLTDLIIIAPEVEVKGNVKGNFQVFAERKIIVGKNAKLDYPTALIVSSKRSSSNQEIKNEKNHDKLIIEEGAQVKGIVGFLTIPNTSNYKAQIILEKNAEVLGEVYCQQNVELKGSVKGRVYTKGFIANQFGTVYKNHIYNGKILSSSLPKQYAGLSFQNSKQGIAKWLY